MAILLLSFAFLFRTSLPFRSRPYSSYHNHSFCVYRLGKKPQILFDPFSKKPPSLHHERGLFDKYVVHLVQYKSKRKREPIKRERKGNDHDIRIADRITTFLSMPNKNIL